MIFIEQGIVFNDDFLCIGMNDIADAHTTQNTVTQCFNDFAALNQGLHGDAIGCATIVLNDNQVLGYVAQTACQITRVRSFQCGISQAFTSAVG